MAEPVSMLGSFRRTVDTAALARNQESFASVLGRSNLTDRNDEDRARAAAEQFLAHSFILPLLKQLRESDRSAPPFAPTQGEKQLRALQDADLAQRIAHASRFPLVDRLARDLLARARKGEEPAEQITEPLLTAPPVPGGITRASAD